MIGEKDEEEGSRLEENRKERWTVEKEQRRCSEKTGELKVKDDK